MGTGWLRRLKVVVTVNVILSLVVGLGGALPASARGKSSASCTNFEFIGARGSGEDPVPNYGGSDFGMGATIFDLYTRVSNLIGTGNVTPYGVHYPAVSIVGTVDQWVNGAGAVLHIGFLGAYTDSVAAGTADVQSQIEAVHQSCPATRFILSGLSQGAQAVGDALQRMPSSDLALVAAAALFGDPYFNANSWSDRSSFDPGKYGLLGTRDEWPASLYGTVFSHCHNADPICQGDRSIDVLGSTIYYRDPFGLDTSQHKNYAAGDQGDTATAANEIGQVVGVATGNEPLDVVFTIDSTGSMGSAISTVQSNIDALAQTIAATTNNYRFALVDFKDDPLNDSPYQAQVDLGFTTDLSALTDAVNTLSAYGGGDTPESVYDGVMTAFSLPWRSGVSKAVVLVGDAPAKDPEPVTGYTLSTVASTSLAIDPANVYAVQVGSDPAAAASYDAIASATGGQFFAGAIGSARTANHLSNRAHPHIGQAGTAPADLVTELNQALTAAGTAPVANAGGPYVAVAGSPVSLSAAASTDATEPIAAYDWDFNNDGTYDATTTGPVVQTTFAQPGSYTVGLRVRTGSGRSTIASTTVTVATAPAAPPATPIGLTATSGDGTLTLQWQAAPGPTAAFFTLRDGNGVVVDRVSSQPGGLAPTSWIDPGLTNGVPYTFTVTASNVAGESGSTAAVTATPASTTVLGEQVSKTAYHLVASDGGIFSFGGARFLGSTGSLHLNQPIVGMAATPDQSGYWLVARDGGIFSFGDAHFLGSTGAIHLNRPIVAMASTPTGHGYWLVASDGGIFAFGDAKFYGSTGAMLLNQPIVGMAATATGHGYYLLATDGGIFAFGDARFQGSMGGTRLNRPVVAGALDPATGGYWMVAADGGVFSFHSPFLGSTGAIKLNKPIVGISVAPDGSGYRFVASDGGIFCFHLPFEGSTGGAHLNQPIVGMSG